MAETKITNGDKIRNMTNEELSELLSKDSCYRCAYQYDDTSCANITCETGHALWVCQEATE